MRTLRAVLLIVGLACVGECCYQQAISAGMTARWVVGLMLSLGVFVGGVAVLAVLGWRDGRHHYRTQAGERAADRALEDPSITRGSHQPHNTPDTGASATYDGVTGAVGGPVD